MKCGNARSVGSSSGHPAPEGVRLVSATQASSAPPQTSHGSWMGVEGLIHPVMMNFAIVLNENRTLTKPHLLLVTLLNVKINNQPLSSQNEINCVSV